MVMIQYGDKSREVDAGTTVLEALEAWDIDIPSVVVCVGRKIVALDHRFQEGDCAQIIKVVCGG